MKPIAPLAFLAVLAGCAGTDWNRNVYEGIRQQQTLPDASGDVKPKVPMPDYERYRRERESPR